MITNHPARYRDPKTGLPYYNSYAYQEIQKLQHGNYKWSRLVGAWLGSGSEAASGVPARFLDPKAPGPPKPQPQPEPEPITTTTEADEDEKKGEAPESKPVAISTSAHTPAAPMVTQLPTSVQDTPNELGTLTTPSASKLTDSPSVATTPAVVPSTSPSEQKIHSLISTPVPTEPHPIVSPATATNNTITSGGNPATTTMSNSLGVPTTPAAVTVIGEANITTVGAPAQNARPVEGTGTRIM